MNNLRTAAQQALEALMKSHTCPLLPDDCENAIAALRAALAQEQAEPFTPDAIHATQAAWKMGYEARRAEEAEPVQEPVAWLSRDDARLALWEAINKREFGNPTDDKLILEHLRQHGLWIGKYTAPPQRVPLTEEEIDRIRAAEREACAKVCEEQDKSIAPTSIEKYRASLIADAIRARSKS